MQLETVVGAKAPLSGELFVCPNKTNEKGNMEDRPKVLRQDKRAIFVSYVAYRVWLAIITYGILVIRDILAYRNFKVLVRGKSVEITRGAIPITTSVDFEKIDGFGVEQSWVGKMVSYGIVKIFHHQSSVVSLRYIHDPHAVADILHKKIQAVQSNAFSAADYAQRQKEEKAAAEAQRKEAEHSGACPRCGSTNIQAVVEHASIKGTGWSHTRRMCLSCRKKF